MPATAPGARNSRVNEVASWLLEYLTHHEGPHLPSVRALVELYPGLVRFYTMDQAFRLLARQGHIARRTGTQMFGKGHAAVRIIATGRVLRTDGCPFEAPE